MKITVLIEDSTQDENLINEFGLALHIEYRDKKILMDTGTSGKFIMNARKLGIDLREVDLAIISHAHSDHAGGLAHFLEINQSAKVYMHHGASNEYFGNIGCKLPPAINFFIHPLVGRSPLFSKYIGLDKTIFEDFNDRLVVISQTTEIIDGVFLISNIEQRYPLPAGNKYLLTKKDGRLQADDFSHELILALQEYDGFTLFTGCCHNGLLNVLDTIQNQLTNPHIKCIVGGFHLRLQPQKEHPAGNKADIISLARELRNRKIGKVYTGHCTGKGAYDFLKEELNENIEPLYTGCTLEI